jgi:gliding motility-associated-like protein
MSLIRPLLFGFCALFAVTAIAQVPENIQLHYAPGALNALKSMVACADQDAGTATQTLGPSSMSQDPTYLCLNDVLIIDHSGGDLTGDPQTLTAPGYGYAFYFCPPTVSGPDLATILGDGCLVQNPPPPNGVWVTTGALPDGDTEFINNGALQGLFNSGSPVQLYFAPITIDNFATNGFESTGGGPPGPCVNANIAQAFPVVYLNGIDVVGITYQTGVFAGSFTTLGGLPEFDGSTYDNIFIELDANPAITGTVTSAPPTDGSTVTFTVPVAGIYNITVEDANSCSYTFQMAFPAVAVSISDEIVAPGGAPCVDVSVVNFQNMSDFSFTLTYNPAILTYTGSANLNLSGFTAANIVETSAGTINLDWITAAPAGISVPNNTVIGQLCFDAIGVNGQTAPIGYAGIIDFNNTTGPTGVIPQSGSVTLSTGGFAIVVTPDSISCGETPELSNGSINIQVIGGAAPYSFDWAGQTNGLSGSGIINVSGGSQTIPNLPAGTYGVTVTTGFGQSQTATVEVETASPLFVSLTATNPSCSNLSNGSINISSLGGGVGPYDIEWNLPGNNGDLTLPNLPQGNYVVTVTDTRGCIRVAASSIGVNPILVTGSNVVEATCLGVNDGVINVLGISGGTPQAGGDYTFDWGIGPATVGTSSSIVNLTPGTYTITITDINSCTATAAYVVNPDKILVINAAITDPNCFDQPTGIITAIGVTVGAPAALPYTFTWSPNAGTPIINPTNTLASGLSADTYTLNLTDTDGCTFDTTFTLVEPIELLVALVNQTNESCLVGGDGSLNVSASGGTLAVGSSYQYNWSNLATTPNISPLVAADYTVTVTDDNGCVSTQVFTILPPQPPAINGFIETPPSCFDVADGVLTVDVIAGAGTITNYQWVNQNGGIAQTGATLNGMLAGTYTVTVTDAAGCTVVSSYVFVGPDQMVLADTTLDSPTCPGFTNGSIILNVTGGTPGLIYTLVGGPTQGFSVFPGLDAGDYSFSVTDQNGCPALTFDIELVDPPMINILFSAIDSVSCASQLTNCDGTATAVASGGSANVGSYNFIWQSGEVSAGITSTASGLCAGAQMLIVNDNICGDTFYVDIPSPAVITSVTATTATTCFGFCDGTMEVFPQGGTPPYILTWSTGFTANPQDNLCADLYNVLITDSKGCSFVANGDVSQPDTLIAVIDPFNTTGISCNNSDDGQIGVIYTGGNNTIGNYTYTWLPPVGSTEIVDNLAPGTYTIAVSDPLGCVDTAVYTLIQPDPIIAIIPTPDLPLCFGYQTTISVDTAFGGNGGPFFFSVDYGPEYELGDQAPAYAGEHIVSVIDFGQGKECFLDSIIYVNEPPAIVVDLGPDTQIELGENFEMEPVITSAFPLDFDSIFWTPLTYLIPTTDPRYPTVSPISPTTYTLTVFDLNGCTGTDDLFIDVDRNRNVFIPNIFTPDGDDINDFSTVFLGLGVQQLQYFYIYDRWGTKMYEVEGMAPGTVFGWDGSYRGELMAPQVLTYIAQVRFIDGVTLLFKGDITIVR